jgi:threonine/homoserine/homoserine lactone efflux protein
VLWAFLPIAALVTITPGPATALILRSALRGGVPAGLATIAANSLGVLVWGALSVLGISALVAASEVAFAVLKGIGALVLVALGLQALCRARRGVAVPELGGERRELAPRAAFRDGLLTSLANPKLAVFFVALFPQFVPEGASVLPATLLMAATIVALDLAWYGGLVALVVRTRRAIVGSRLGTWLERVTGGVLVALGLRVALDARS